MSSFQDVETPLNTEVSSFQGVEIEEFYYIIQRCLHFRGLGIEGVPSVLISGG